MERFKLLDAFRGAAILWIVCFHILADVRGQYNLMLNYFLSDAQIGVVVFFVISGYGVAASTHGGVYFDRPREFLLRRFKRLYFCYWWHLLFAALIIPFLIGTILMLKTHSFNMKLAPYSFIDWLQIAALTRVFEAESWSLHTPFLPLNGAIWFIAIIAQIYLFAAICICFKEKFYFLMFCGFLASLLTQIPSVRNLIPFGLFLPDFAKFYIGFAGGVLLKKGHVPKNGTISVVVLIILLTITLFCAVEVPRFLKLSVAGFIGFLLLVLYRYDHALSKWRIVKIFNFIGIFSYSLYLLHLPLFPLVKMFTNKLLPFTPYITYPFAVIPVIIVISYFWYYVFERSSRQAQVIGCLAKPLDTFRSGIQFAKNML